MLSAFGRFNKRGGGGGCCPLSAGSTSGGGCLRAKKKKKSQYRLTVAVSGKIQCSIDDKRVVAHN